MCTWRGRRGAERERDTARRGRDTAREGQSEIGGGGQRGREREKERKRAREREREKEIILFMRVAYVQSLFFYPFFLCHLPYLLTSIVIISPRNVS
jgi:hypothetical protein